MTVEVFTDGSCNTKTLFGAWAAIIFINNTKHSISGPVKNTTHNRMELMAVIEALKFIRSESPTITKIKIISDSQYVIGIQRRLSKFESNSYKTKAGEDIRNIDLVKELTSYFKLIEIDFIKIKAHQKPNEEINYNIEVDKICRKLMRAAE